MQQIVYGRHVTGAPFQRTLAEDRLSVAGFGRYYDQTEGLDWTFRNLRSQSDASNDSALRNHLPTIARELGVKEVVVPTPTEFNGLIYPSDLMDNRITLGSVVVRRRLDLPADGVILAPGEAFAVSAAGCAVLVGWRIHPSTHRLLRAGAAHAGLRSICNNVGDNLLAALGGIPADTYFSIEFPISSEVLVYSWDYPGSEAKNEALCNKIAERFGTSCLPGWHDPVARRKGRVNIAEMLRVQLRRLGVPPGNIRAGIEVGLDEQFYTTRNSDKRNLFVVAYHK